MLSIGFIGAGAVAASLAEQLCQCGYAVVAVSSRHGVSAAQLAVRLPGCSTCRDNQEVAERADLVFIATPDDDIDGVCREIKWHPLQYVVHLSGAATAQKLEAAGLAGAFTGVCHPLQTFIRDGQANLAGVTFALEAEEPVLGVLKDMVIALGGRWLVLSAGDRVLYHAAAVMASNYVVTLTKLAADLWERFDVPPEDAVTALLPLIKGTVENIETIGLPGCLTGPIARGDSQTIVSHLAALREYAPAVEPAYRELGLQTIPIALAKGQLETASAAQIRVLLTEKG